MNMETFWSKVPRADKLKLDYAQAVAQFPSAFAAADRDEDFNVEACELAHTVIPNIGPGGATTEEDEVDLAQRDPNEEIADADGPSVTGQVAFMAYNAEVDELWLWYPDDNRWRLWNY